MGQTITLKAKDGHSFSAYRADPAGKPKGAIVVIQEIFGVNHHIKAVADGFAKEGYVAVAPALFDRSEKNVDLGYDQAGMTAGRGHIGKIPMDKIGEDTQAAIDYAKQFGKVGIVGYCLGGSVAFRAATQLNGIDAAVGYYGGQIASIADQKPKVPTMLHFGDQDQSIPPADVDKIKTARGGDSQIFVYQGAGHGFNCDERPSWNADAAKTALQRTLDFFKKHIG
ncbi:MAG TPA: dienelactone hydrolase family protein [Stellaceae bacterium]|nr:dienelactone hydrolase family protein [Stellaceae bacterium]